MKSTLTVLKVFSILLIIKILTTKFLKKLAQLFHYIRYGGEKGKIFKFSIHDTISNDTYYIFSILELVLSAFILYLLYTFFKVLSDFSNNKIFTSTNAKRLRNVGTGLVIFGILIVLTEASLRFTLNIDNHHASNDMSVNTSYNFGYGLGQILAKKNLNIYYCSIYSIHIIYRY